MAYGGKRGGAGDRVLESRHVIGLFLLMLLFSGVFFSLGYVMGRNQYDGQVRAATNPDASTEVARLPRTEAAPKHANKNEPSTVPNDAATPPNSDWEFYHAGDSSKPDARLRPAVPGPKTPTAIAKSGNLPKAAGAAAKSSLHGPLIPGGAYILQVAAMRQEPDAMALASNLQKKRFPAFVLSPQADKYYRVQVGPYTDRKSAEVAKKGLEGAGFKAIVKH